MRWAELNLVWMREFMTEFMHVHELRECRIFITCVCVCVIVVRLSQGSMLHIRRVATATTHASASIVLCANRSPQMTLIIQLSARHGPAGGSSATKCACNYGVLGAGDAKSIIREHARARCLMACAIRQFAT